MLDMSIESKHDQERMSADMKRFDMKIDDLTDSHLLDKLRHVAEAGFIAQKEPLCLPGTRMKLLDGIMSWCTDASRPQVFWLSGMAGTGKSAIARTLCDQLTRTGLLGGSFFCSRRGAADQRDVQRIIPTLARHLCRLDLEYRKRVVECLKRDSDIVSATVERQLEKLIVEPCSEGTSFKSLSTPLILVIDALDEGSQAEDIARLLEAIFEQVYKAAIPLRFFLTSRPESHIRDKFQYSTHSSQHATFYLHEIEETIVRADIRLCLTRRLEKINKVKYRLPAQWPEDGQIEALVNRADKLFIYAFLACNFIERDPRRRLQNIIETSCSDEQSLTERLDQMYTLVLDEAKNPSNIDSYIMTIIEKCLIVLIFIPKVFSFAQLSSFIETDVQDIETAVDQLHSLILLPSSLDDAITTLHASFGDYLTNQRRSGKHFISTAKSRLLLLQRCFDIMDSELCFNVAKAHTSFLSNDMQHLSVSWRLIYASEHWTDHIVKKGSKKQLVTIVAWIEKTLLPKFLFWLEVFSVISKVKHVIIILEKLLPFVETIPELATFITDTIRFVKYFKEPISQSMPHIYLSALSFASQVPSSIERFHLDYSRLAKIEYIGIERPKDLEYSYVAISPDGIRIASGSYDGRLYLSDARTSRLVIQPIQGHAGLVTSVIFSPYGTLFASGSSDSTVCVWNAQNCQLTIPPLSRKQTSPMSSLIFSPDGTSIFSGYWDGTIHVWNIKTGHHVMQLFQVPFGARPTCITSLGLSPDGTRVVFASDDDQLLHIWDVRAAHTIIHPIQHTSTIRSVAFSPDGNRIASGLYDNTVHVWDVGTGQSVLRPLHGHKSVIESVVFSLDGTRIVSGSRDKTLNIWDAKTGDLVIGPLQGHVDRVISVAFSSDGTRIISGSYDHMVRVWETTIAQLWFRPYIPEPPVIPSNSFQDVAVPTSTPVLPSINKHTKIDMLSQVSPFQLPQNPFSHCPHSSNPRDLFKFDIESGWITGPNKELLIWIPEDLRLSLYMPRTINIMYRATRLILDLSCFAYGSDWTSCKQPICS